MRDQPPLPATAEQPAPTRIGSGDLLGGIRPYYEDAHCKIYNGDSRELLPDVHRADLVIADPPYTFGLSSTQQKASKGGGWADLMNNALFYALILREVKRITKQTNGAAWFFNSWRSMPVLQRASWESDWPIESMLVWDKGPEVGMGGCRGLRSQYELVALLVQDGYQIANRSTKDILNVPWGGSSPRSNHPAEKPVALMVKLIECSTKENALILDPFCGSGTSLIAAKQTGRSAIGIEMEECHCETAAKRLTAEMSLMPSNDKMSHSHREQP